jgi:tetratricopeptide (TPR) repeat protein
MIHSIEHIIIFNIILIVILLLTGCQQEEASNMSKMNPYSSNNQSNVYSNSEQQQQDSNVGLLITEDSKKMRVLIEYKKLFLTGDYEKAIILLPELEKEFLENYDKETTFDILHDISVFPYVMLENDEEALKKSTEIIRKYSEGNLPFFVFVGRISILSRLNLVDEIIAECQKQLQITSNMTPSYLTVLLCLIDGYSIKHEFEQAKYCLAKANKYVNTNEIQNIRDRDITKLKILNFFLIHLCETYEYRFIKGDLPQHPIVDPEDRTKISFELPLRTAIFSKADGSILTYGDLANLIDEEKKKLLLDPFMEELNRQNEQEIEKKDIEQQKKK